MTVAPLSTSVPAAGAIASTVPGSSSSSSRSVNDTCSPRDSSACSASSRFWPTTSGSSTLRGPRETTSVTVLPRSIRVRSGGDVSITRFDRTSSLYSRRTSTLKPASSSCFSASPRGEPRTNGIVASPGPLETMIVTVAPSSASCPGCGRCVATRSAGTLSERTFSTFTSKPWFCRIWAAVPERRPTTSSTGTFSGTSSR